MSTVEEDDPDAWAANTLESVETTSRETLELVKRLLSTAQTRAQAPSLRASDVSHAVRSELHDLPDKVARSVYSNVAGQISGLREALAPQKPSLHGKLLAALLGAFLALLGAFGAVTFAHPSFLLADLTSTACTDFGGIIGSTGSEPVCVFNLVE
ncbi:hypothetical protein [Breoghania sp. JC706]|uniref:hypothetical protein n=1 Tax=Breoghania sp. JC706 TaxID=3117732 RepID=UPI0030093F2C